MNLANENRPARRRLALPIAALLLVVGLIFGGRLALSLTRVQQDLRALKEMGGAGMLFFGASDSLSNIENLVTQSVNDVRELRGALGPFVNVLPALGWMPRYGGDLKNAPALLDFAEQTLVAAQATLVFGNSLNAELEAGQTAGTPIGMSLLTTAQSQRMQIQNARARLAEANRARQKIDATTLSTFSQELLNRFDRWMPVWQAGVEVLANAPGFLGAERPRHYLLIAQNSDELRATGGFVSAVALVRIEQGRFTVVEFQDSFAVDDLTKPHPAAPEPLWRYMYAWQWLFRDANWSPDFPTSARKLQEIYRIDRDMTVDGVIAFNQRMMPALLAAVGPVTVESYNERLDASNVIDKIHEFWAIPQGPRQTSDWWLHRKDFMGRLMQAVLERLTAGQIDRDKLGRALLDAIESKDLLIYINDVELRDHAGMALGGVIYEGEGDFLMLVDSNLGFNKVDGNISRQIEYSVTMDAARSVRVALVLTYTNLSPDTGTFCVHQPNYQSTYADLQQGCYWNYVRVIVPQASELLRVIGVSDVKKETSDKGYAAFGGYFVLPRGETHVVRFDYRLPSAITFEPRYHLTLQRQPGAPAIPTLIRVTAPDEWSIVATYPAPHRLADNRADFELILERDERIQVGVGKAMPLELIGAVFALGAIVLIGIAWSMRQRRL